MRRGVVGTVGQEEELTQRRFGELPPDELTLVVQATSGEGLDLDALLLCSDDLVDVARIVLIVEVRRRVADEKHELDGAGVAPRRLDKCIVQSLLHVFRIVGATVGLHICDCPLEGCDVAGEVPCPRQELIGVVTVDRQGEANVRLPRQGFDPR